MNSQTLITAAQSSELFGLMFDDISGELTELGCRLYWDLEVYKTRDVTVEFYENRVLPFIANFKPQKAERMATLDNSADEEWIS